MTEALLDRPAQATPEDFTESVPIIDVANGMETLGFFKDAPRVLDMVGQDRDYELHQQPKNYGYIRGLEIGPDRSAFTEATALSNLTGVIDQLVESVPEKDREQAEYFRENMTYLGEAEFSEAAKGLAGYIMAFISENPGKVVSLPVPENRWEKSEGLVQKAVMQELEQLLGENAGDFVRGNLTSEELQALKAGDVQFFVLDDWSVSQSTMKGRIQNLQNQGVTYGERTPCVAEDNSNVEILLMAIRDDQLDDGVLRDFNGAPVAWKGYYRAPKPFGSVHSGPVPTGSHSSVDYGFEETIKLMADDALKSGSLESPLQASDTPLFLKRNQRDW